MSSENSQEATGNRLQVLENSSNRLKNQTGMNQGNQNFLEVSIYLYPDCSNKAQRDLRTLLVSTPSFQPGLCSQETFDNSEMILMGSLWDKYNYSAILVCYR